MNIRTTLKISLALVACTSASIGAEYHVSVDGNDSNPGSIDKPFKTISKGAEVAYPGDVITVYEGIYREEVSPPRGGTSDTARITYRAAAGDKVVIKGSEVAKGWTHVEGDVWKLRIPDPKSFFGDHNPFRTQIQGDWFQHGGRLNHTAQVYLDGEPLTEASSLEEVMTSRGTTRLWYTNDNQLPQESGKASVDLLDIQLNGDGTLPVAVSDAHQLNGARVKTRQEQTFVERAQSGSWIQFDSVNFGERTTQITLNGMTETMGVQIEVRLNGPEGTLLGTGPIHYTGNTWGMNWQASSIDIESVSGTHPLYLVFKDLPEPAPNSKEVIIWAQFKEVDPNEALVELNARETVFYPRKTGIHYITVSGFTLEHGSPNWAPPTAEQVGLIGTHWSKGWIIENNIIRHASCVGLTLGKYGDEYDNTSADNPEGYVETIERATEHGWSKEHVGSHIVRNNTIHSCGAAGICGSLGAIFSEITGNHIYDININKPWTGYEMAGIKFHAPIDMLIKNNRVHHTSRGLWLDWMTQGTRVTGNLFYDNGRQDVYLEVNHGPFIIDNNIFATKQPWSTLKDRSQGGTFAHNLFLNTIDVKPDGRTTPYHEAHSTKVLGFSKINGGDSRFYNNVFAGNGLIDYSETEFPCTAHGNVYLKDAQPMAGETGHIFAPNDAPDIQLSEAGDTITLKIQLPEQIHEQQTQLVTTDLLGNTQIAHAAFENPDGSPLTIDLDYLGNTRNHMSPLAGPFEQLEPNNLSHVVWPIQK